MKENIDVLRTMIKELDNRGQEKVTPRRLFNGGSGGAGSENSQTRPSAEEVGGKSQRNPSKNKEPAHLRRSRRLEDQSITKEKTRRERYKSIGKRSEHQETWSDSEREEGSEDASFMHGHGHPELAKKLNDKIPKTVDELFERVRAFIRGEVAAGSAELVRPSQGDKGYIRSAETGGPEKARNRSGPKEAQRNMRLKKQIEEVVASGKLAHLVKDIRQNNQRSRNQGRNDVKVINMIREGGNRKRPFEEETLDLTDELTFPAIPRN
ncbi:hypothetical protein Tco_1216530 [Tanacetum coccineum]